MRRMTISVDAVVVFLAAGRKQDAYGENANDDGHYKERRSNMHDNPLDSTRVPDQESGIRAIISDHRCGLLAIPDP